MSYHGRIHRCKCTDDYKETQKENNSLSLELKDARQLGFAVPTPHLRYLVSRWVAAQPTAADFLGIVLTLLQIMV